MRLSFAAVFAAVVAGVVATEPAEDVSTVMVTETTTYCPSSSAAAVTSTPASEEITTSNGLPYTVTRPMITSTITHCNKWYLQHRYPQPQQDPHQVPHPPPLLDPLSSTPGVNPTGSATTPAAPIFTGGASRAAAGAGAGLATVFGLVAYLL
ncbi:hypothetical protein P168DRAFT_318320 [Aspergillus campestris IBT 28561]|uniref:GPI anchored protein n=1 Tax=Aspergillus campestris (strain IBT 28561) TaxID=1392248 RepID=A0A2I1D601_ASPC2|nr:uncharacterized protein P168DRAFT_318320 [Aspergillus campestris IBT 28561]PKY05304.1 hypothetical protein P168DRAFT_318320 [Aspergillus campestris IBT 28561]